MKRTYRSEGGGKTGCKGDPRMNAAVAAKLKNPKMPLFYALRAGGFNYTSTSNASKSVDDNITLGQRKNQLNRRLRQARKQHQQRVDEDQKSTYTESDGSIHSSYAGTITADDTNDDRDDGDDDQSASKAIYSSKMQMNNDALPPSINEDNLQQRLNEKIGCDTTTLQYYARYE